MGEVVTIMVDAASGHTLSNVMTFAGSRKNEQLRRSSNKLYLLPQIKLGLGQSALAII